MESEGGSIQGEAEMWEGQGGGTVYLRRFAKASQRRQPLARVLKDK